MYNRLTPCILLLLSICSLKAFTQKNLQPGYVITQNHDTLRGRIDFKEWTRNPRTIQFFPDDAASPASYSPDNISCFSVAGESYFTFTVRIYPFSLDPVTALNNAGIDSSFEKKLFLRLLVGGKIDLFYYQDSTATEYFFTRSGNEKLVQLRIINHIITDNGQNSVANENLYQSQLSRLLQDCPSAAAKAAHARYFLSDIKKLVFQHNYCGQDTVQQVSSVNRTKLTITPQIGLAHTKLHFSGTNGLGDIQYPASNSAAAGATILLVLPRLEEKIAFGIDLLYKHVNADGKHTGSGQNYITATTANYNALNLSLLFRYAAPKSHVIRPFAEAGFGNAFIMSNKSYQYSSAGETPLLGSDFKKNQMLFFGGGGVKLKQLSVSARFEYSSGMSPYVTLASPVNSLYFLVGWTF